MNDKYSLPIDNFSIIENELICSPAFLGLTGTAKNIYLLLRTRAMVERPRNERPGRQSRAYIKNNGKLTLTYKEIEELLGLSSSTIASAFKKLEQHGLIDVVVAGQGRKRIKSQYALSQRWRQYGKPGFQDVKVYRNVCPKGARRLKEERQKRIQYLKDMKAKRLPPLGHSDVE